MRTFVLTGYSDKLEGFLFVVDGDSVADALGKVATSMERVVDLEEGGLFLVPKHVPTAEVLAAIAEEMDGRYNFWQVFGEELTKDVNLRTAVCW